MPERAVQGNAIHADNKIYFNLQGEKGIYYEIDILNGSTSYTEYILDR